MGEVPLAHLPFPCQMHHAGGVLGNCLRITKINLPFFLNYFITIGTFFIVWLILSCYILFRSLIYFVIYLVLPVLGQDHSSVGTPVHVSASVPTLPPQLQKPPRLIFRSEFNFLGRDQNPDCCRLHLFTLENSEHTPCTLPNGYKALKSDQLEAQHLPCN